MRMRMPKPTKAELVMMFLNKWDHAHGADKDFRFYQVEAIAQKIRKNSKQESVENALREAEAEIQAAEKRSEEFSKSIQEPYGDVEMPFEGRCLA